MMRKNLMAACDHVTQSEVVTRHKKKGSMFMFLFSVIALNLVSLYVLSTTMANAHTPSSNSKSNTNSTASNETGVKQMGICVIGSKSPCNGDRNSPT